MSSLLMSPSKAFFISITVFYISSVSFWFFLKVSISLLIFPIYSCTLFTFSIRDLSIFTIVVLNSWSHKSNISAICETGCTVSSVSLNCALCISKLCNFCLKLDMMYWVNGTEVNRPLNVRFYVYLDRNKLCLLFAVPIRVRG